jgi:hypothetical protein
LHAEHAILRRAITAGIGVENKRKVEISRKARGPDSRDRATIS